MDSADLPSKTEQYKKEEQKRMENIHRRNQEAIDHLMRSGAFRVSQDKSTLIDTRFSSKKVDKDTS